MSERRGGGELAGGGKVLKSDGTETRLNKTKNKTENTLA